MSTCSSIVSPSQLLVDDSQSESNVSPTLSQRPSLKESVKSMYQSAQQVKFLDLQAEVESLLQQLQTLKQQRVSTVGCEHQE